MVENGAFVSGDNPLLNNLSSVHFTMKKCSFFKVKRFKFVLKLQSGRVC
ncbi:hypothetical protein ECDEC3D_4945 [Escherichia coli DEC3D]|nr:hypothetical protein ECDEC3D_4945 [Escherichia coli DEC3D]